MKENIGVLGAGSWGATLAILLHKKNYNVSLWEPFKKQAEILDKTRILNFLPDITIPKEIPISSDIADSLYNKDIIVFVVPSHFLREVAVKVKEILSKKNLIVVSAVKGLENNTYMRMSEILKEELESKNITVLSGPSHSEEVSKEIPTSVVIAGKDKKNTKYIQNIFSTDYFRTYTSPDVIGVEMGGALKNIIAIGCGVCDGLGLGDNTKAALMTRGLAEIVRLGLKLTAKRETFFGLSGVGDLFVTCMSRHSRNRLLGEKIGRGKKLKDALSEMTMVAEGVKTTKAAYDLSAKLDVEMPITKEIYLTLYENKNPRDAVLDLMRRKLKDE